MLLLIKRRDHRRRGWKRIRQSNEACEIAAACDFEEYAAGILPVFRAQSAGIGAVHVLFSEISGTIP
jgi:hypothetical protein